MPLQAGALPYAEPLLAGGSSQGVSMNCAWMRARSAASSSTTMCVLWTILE